MINRARLVQCLPWQRLAESRIEPDREAIAAAVAAWLENPKTRSKPADLTESLADAKKALKQLKLHLRAASLLSHELPIYDSAGERADYKSMLVAHDLAGQHRKPTYADLLASMELNLESKEIMPHPAPNTSPTQWQTLTMRGIFWNLQDAGLVDWLPVSNADQARFLSAALLEAASAIGKNGKAWDGEKWRKSRDKFFTKTPRGYTFTRET